MASNCRTNSLLNSNQSRVVNGHLAVRAFLRDRLRNGLGAWSGLRLGLYCAPTGLRLAPPVKVQYKAAWRASLPPKPIRSGLQHGPNPLLAPSFASPNVHFSCRFAVYPSVSAFFWPFYRDIYRYHTDIPRIGDKGRWTGARGWLAFLLTAVSKAFRFRVHVSQRGTGTRKAPYNGRIFVRYAGHLLAVSLLKTSTWTARKRSYPPETTVAVRQRSRSGRKAVSDTAVVLSIYLSATLYSHVSTA